MGKCCGKGDIGGDYLESVEDRSEDRVCQYAGQRPGFFKLDLVRRTNTVQLASWLVRGTVIVLLQEPFLVNICLTFTGRSAYITRRTHAILDPIFFTLMYECITQIGYWQHEDNSEEAEDTGMYGSSVLGRILGSRETFTMGILNFFRD